MESEFSFFFMQQMPTVIFAMAGGTNSVSTSYAATGTRTASATAANVVSRLLILLLIMRQLGCWPSAGTMTNTAVVRSIETWSQFVQETATPSGKRVQVAETIASASSQQRLAGRCSSTSIRTWAFLYGKANAARESARPPQIQNPKP